MRFKNVIFDFGGIIVDLDRQAAVDAFEALGCRVAGSIGLYAQKGVFAALETGRMADAEFFGFVRPQAGRDIPDDDIRRAWNRMLVGGPRHRLQAVLALRPRFRTFMLSNTNALHWDRPENGRSPCTRGSVHPRPCPFLRRPTVIRELRLLSSLYL